MRATKALKFFSALGLTRSPRNLAPVSRFATMPSTTVASFSNFKTNARETATSMLPCLRKLKTSGRVFTNNKRSAHQEIPFDH